jgi:hypothetical protein
MSYIHWRDYLKGIIGEISAVDWVNSTWFLYICAAALLTGSTRDLLSRRKILLLAEQLGNVLNENTVHIQLYSRILSGSQVKPSLPRLLRFAAGEQVKASVAVSRLHTFTVLALCSLVFVLLPSDFSAIRLLWKIVVDIAQVEVFHNRPTEWTTAYESLKSIASLLLRQLMARIRLLQSSIYKDSTPLILNCVFFVSLCLNSRIPSILQYLHNLKSDMRYLNCQMETETINSGSVLLSNMGASSANRLKVLKPDGSLDIFLDRWLSIQRRSDTRNTRLQHFDPIHDLIDGSAYHGISALLLMIPFIIQAHTAYFSNKLDEWIKLFDVGLVMIAVFSVTKEAIRYTTRFFQFSPFLRLFYQVISSTSDNDSSRKTSQPIQKRLSSNPLLGIDVKDFWAAHVSRR